ncbi:hypothetical protein ACFFLI_02095 [Lactiplantibacillus modestisalitolerans]|uniref:WxL domain-containing protein n=2 Tax=Lactiplantibacillus modestisalitolerans TaxID=1457219 RepID=A0ABV5WR77_9LACO
MAIRWAKSWENYYRLLLMFIAVLGCLWLIMPGVQAETDAGMQSILGDGNRLEKLTNTGKFKIGVKNYPYLKDVLADHTQNGWVTKDTTKIQIVFSGAMALAANYPDGPYFDLTHNVRVEMGGPNISKVSTDVTYPFTYPVFVMRPVPTVNRLRPTLTFPPVVEMNVDGNDLLKATPDNPLYLKLVFSAWKINPNFGVLHPLANMYLYSTNEYALAQFPVKQFKGDLHPKIDTNVTVESDRIEGTADSGSVVSLLTPFGSSVQVKDGHFSLPIPPGSLVNVPIVRVKETLDGDEGIGKAYVSNPFSIQAKKLVLLTPGDVADLTKKVDNKSNPARVFADKIKKLADVKFLRNGQELATPLDHLVVESEDREGTPDKKNYAESILAPLLNKSQASMTLKLRAQNSSDTIIAPSYMEASELFPAGRPVEPYQLTVALMPELKDPAAVINSAIHIPAAHGLKRLTPKPVISLKDQAFGKLTILAQGQLSTSDQQHHINLIYHDGRGGQVSLATKQPIATIDTQTSTELTAGWYQAATPGTLNDKGIFVDVPANVRRGTYTGTLKWFFEAVP